MTPAQQGFRADNPTTAQIDDGLVVQFKLPALDRLGQFSRLSPEQATAQTPAVPPPTAQPPAAHMAAAQAAAAPLPRPAA